MANEKTEEKKPAAPKISPEDQAAYDKCTHPHDIERLFRLGLLSPARVAALTAEGKLPEVA